MNMALPGLETESVRCNDIVMTPRDIARDVVKFFAPSGRVLDPCRGNGAFADEMPGCEWCEIRDGRDFFGWKKPVDWIVSNPPYSVFPSFLRHSFTVAENVVYLIPITKVFTSEPLMRDIWKWGGLATIYIVGSGRHIGLPLGFAVGAVHFKRGFTGDTRTVFRAGGGGAELVGDSAATTRNGAGSQNEKLTDSPRETVD